MPWRLADVCPEDDVQCLVGRGWCKSGAPPVEAARQRSKRPRGNECDNNCHLVVKCRKCCLDVKFTCRRQRDREDLEPFSENPFFILNIGVSTLQFSSGHLQLLCAQMVILTSSTSTSNAFHANRFWQNLSPFFSSFAEFGEIDMRAWRQLAWTMSTDG